MCTIDMAVGPLDKATVKLLPDQLNMKQTTDMAIFHITKWNLDFKSNRDEGLQMTIFMKRKITSEMMTTYFPSLLLTAITFATTFFKPYFFEAALSVNLTTMLVMTTIFISKMESLPPTSATKMIDIWLILCQMVPFAEVVLLTAMEYNRKDRRIGKKAKRKRRRNTMNFRTTSFDVAPMEESMFDGEIKTGKLCLNFSRIPSGLKTLGEFVFNCQFTPYDTMSLTHLNKQTNHVTHILKYLKM